MTTDKSSEREALKPCPFCAGEASQRTEHDSDMVRWGYIGCRCGVRTRGKFGDLCPLTWAEIRGEWNARAALPQQAQEALDARRYRWLKEQILWQCELNQFSGPKNRQYLWSCRFSAPFHEENGGIDGAIDAAMEAWE